ncbi:L,D-transpeptidase family protein [Marinobacter caseinilyticus]|uniref:L,D-transpeptidase family protein n=1 Tax=Marinobacter caseinilyticus TaxID=2692195 RepID=UPI001F017AD1|nr:L,D-transpeptidase family protein [Marinobacter caseinilyticus]
MVWSKSVWALALVIMVVARPGYGEEATAEPNPNPEPEALESRVPSWKVEGDLVGGLGVMRTVYEDTFAEIGSQISMGYLELVKANPGVDPWLPGLDTQITLPRQYVLPDVKREGIVINLAEYRLYYFNKGTVSVYPVGVGTDDNPSPLTDARVTMRLESPAWYPPDSVRAEYEADGDYLPRMIPPGPENPLGSHALLLSEKGYLIHGTNKGFGVGMQVSHGCFRMYNEDIKRFVYDVDKGTSVQVINQPVKIGMQGKEVWLEVHRPDEDYSDAVKNELWRKVSERLEAFRAKQSGVEIQRHAIELAVEQADGIPRMIGERLTQVAADISPADGRITNQSPAETAEQPVKLLF